MMRFKVNRISELLAFWVLQAGLSQGRREEVAGGRGGGRLGGEGSISKLY